MLPSKGQYIVHFDKLSDLTDLETRCTMSSTNLWPVFIFRLTVGTLTLDYYVPHRHQKCRFGGQPTPHSLEFLLSQCASARNLGVKLCGEENEHPGQSALHASSGGNLRAGGAAMRPWRGSGMRTLSPWRPWQRQELTRADSQEAAATTRSI